MSSNTLFSSSTTMTDQRQALMTASTRQQHKQGVDTLFCLPPAIRKQIFEYIFDVGTIYVNINPWAERANKSRPPAPKFCCVTDEHTAAPPAQLLSQTLISRQFRAETVKLPYTLNIFEAYFGDVKNFAERIPRQVQEVVQVLKLEVHQLWCLRESDIALTYMDGFKALQKVVLLQRARRKFSGLKRKVEEAMVVYANLDVEVETEYTVKGSVEDAVAMPQASNLSGDYTE